MHWLEICRQLDSKWQLKNSQLFLLDINNPVLTYQWYLLVKKLDKSQPSETENIKIYNLTKSENEIYIFIETILKILFCVHSNTCLSRGSPFLGVASPASGAVFTSPFSCPFVTAFWGPLKLSLCCSRDNFGVSPPCVSPWGGPSK